jgi:mannose-6-phosphate isomerase-like protein (cupin superfamily)
MKVNECLELLNHKEEDAYFNPVAEESNDSTWKTTGGFFGWLKPKIVVKTWGHEEIFINVPDLYCMKALYFNPGGSTSKHFHCSKHESFFVSKGIIIVRLYNKGLGSVRLTVGESFVVPPGLVHSICNGGDEEACLIEASTFSQDSDSNRIG